ncbi:GNAT family N-acetyltransferase [Enterococcus cecorum]|uniref:GNAT family N-acetyltransferase n=1 Tax=Enterococcus cecorum TaxID=44008 RepID=UPI0022D53254|nr:GNAT family N-acetyltransferase [Enterococcus cecorum]CAI3257655.1 GNAT family N-acetyltransferase [Enterococcus cecorum]CAI3261598.1 GNAT family N-acetyltransferase [Enterococcus cecorum]CAI3262930.1 GNAT family N-acetyltransferase [Enterococcus cecorum]CAI3263161.1 GNAT family N-acetyltransferase [Enterococcus cecorum]CAI3274438.1 GNAT family N-acetyltransferase [Enterococcus cecorum]
MIRKYEISDHVDICKICNKELRYNCEKSLVSKQLENLNEDREMVFVAELNARVVGFIHVEKYNVLYLDSMVNILGLAVLSNYQEQGLGRKLIDAAIQWAKEMGIYTLRLNSGINRKEAHQFYRRIGFGEEKEQYRFIKNI